MKRIAIAVLVVAAAFAIGQAFIRTAPETPAGGSGVAAAAAPVSWLGNEDYVLFGWNSLGMHCINPSYKELCVLPPYNTLMVQIVRRGNPPKIITTGAQIQYTIQGNTTVRGKTDFWQYAQALFGVKLREGVGLTGNGLTGDLVPGIDLSGYSAAVDHYEATGIPVLPFSDRMVWNAFQVADVRLRNGGGKGLGSGQIVLPVSDDLHCDKCHADGGDAGGFTLGSVERNILGAHDKLNGTKFVTIDPKTGKPVVKTPVLCASCHADNALGAAGQPGRHNLSLAMHNWHANICSDMPTCYDCHPGQKTHCQRTAIVGMGPVQGDPRCDRCHGDLQTMADNLLAGRRPWIDEPSCSQCHGSNYDTGGVLYRNAKGHGGLYCAACHNSPHAWWPSRLAADDLQPCRIQGTPFSIGGRCGTCHTTPQIGDSPHVQYDFSAP